MSRTRHEITSTFPEISGALSAQRHGDFVVDGLRDDKAPHDVVRELPV